MTASTATLTDNITRRLDEFESNLPSIPARALGLGRAATRRVFDTTGTVASTIARQCDNVLGTASTSAKTATGQARSGATRTAKTAATAVKQTAGQARAEVTQTVDAGVEATERLLDAGTRAVDPDLPNSGAPYETWTKEQLYHRAQDLDIDGRSSMTKKQLVSALRAA
jgi:hypothetical protein